MQHQETYRIMGIDPGTNYMGYGVLEIEGRNVRVGALRHRPAGQAVLCKLHYVFGRVRALVGQYLAQVC